MLLQESRPRTFHPQLIENVAAEVFWGYCFRTHYDTAIADVLDFEYEKLWSLKKAGEMVRRYGGSLCNADLRRLYDEVNSYMRMKAEREENILGTLYVEDFARCKPPRFAHGDLVKRLRSAGDDDASIEGIAPPVAGDLLLRTPLPSCVLLRSNPPTDVIRVADTRKALGFQKTMLLTIRTGGTLPPNPQGYTHAAHGVFGIPCQDEAISPVWWKLIPNAHTSRTIRLF